MPRATSAEGPRTSSPETAAVASREPLAPLPQFLTPLVGREREIAALRELLLRSDVPLVTLIGPGGIGKTRLAVRVADERSVASPDGVSFVPLAAITDPALVLPTIAQTLGVREVGDRPLLDRLATSLQDRLQVLVLDNMEQVLGAAPLLAELLSTCPGLTILATSRSPLLVSGEHIFAVPPLALPDSRVVQSGLPLVEELPRFEAVRLFVDRARAAQSDFELTDANAAAVTEVCRRLDGVPLAIELAAARVRAVPPAILLARLGQWLPLLTEGVRDAPVRLRTMRDAIGWSHHLLDEHDRIMFRRLSVFIDGFTLEAAEAVAGEDSGVDVLTGVAALVDASLLRMEVPHGFEPRYLMLETVREFALEQLATSGDEATVRGRHAAWCLAFAERTEQEMAGPEQRRWAQCLEREHANLRAAHAWFVEQAAAGPAIRMAGALWAYWFIRGHLREGAVWIAEALALDANVPTNDQVRAIWGAGMLAWAQGDFATAEAHGVRARSLAVADGLVFGEATSLYLLFLATKMQGRRDEAIAHGEMAVSLMRETGVRSWLAYVLADVGTALVDAADRERGEAFVEEGLALHREFGNKQGLGNKLSDLGRISHDAGDLHAAARHYAESLRLLWEGGDAWYFASPIDGLATLAVETGQATSAARLLGATAALRERSGATVWPAEQARLDTTTAAVRAAIGEEACAQALSAGRATPLTEIVAEALAVANALLSGASSIGTLHPADAAGLSVREQEVLRLLVAGNSNPEIAEALFIGRGTVKTHVGNILVKLGASTRTEAAAIAHRRGLV